jgi:hypothetical protein
MIGVQFVTDEQGQRVGVLLDLKQWGELWEDIYDSVMAMERSGEPQCRLKTLRPSFVRKD